MAKQKVEKKRKRSRKARTEVSSSSENNSPSPTPPPPEQDNEPATESTSDSRHEVTSPLRMISSIGEMEALLKQPAVVSPEQAFEDFYLRQATKEFANDLDNLRSAPDFNGRSVSNLIQALKQGTACFAAEERRRVGGVLGGK